MTQEVWSAVDEYINGLFVPPDPGLDEALRAITAAGLPAVSVSPSQGKFLNLLARIQGVRKILEIGTLGGYSTIWLARALPPEGHLITLEADAKHAEVASKNIEFAGVGNLVELRVGPAQETLPKLAEEGCGPFDLIFVDADKENNPLYFHWALKLARRGSVIVVDNVIRDGKIADLKNQDCALLGIRRFNELVASDARVSATEIQTVGSKGYDGFALAVVLADAN